METGKEKGFFSSAMTLIKSRQETSGVILVKGLDPPNPISLFCDAPFPNFMISTMQVHSSFYVLWLILVHGVLYS